MKIKELKVGDKVRVSLEGYSDRCLAKITAIDIPRISITHLETGLGYSLHQSRIKEIVLKSECQDRVLICQPVESGSLFDADDGLNPQLPVPAVSEPRLWQQKGREACKSDGRLTDFPINEIPHHQIEWMIGWLNAKMEIDAACRVKDSQPPTPQPPTPQPACTLRFRELFHELQVDSRMHNTKHQEVLWNEIGREFLKIINSNQ